MGGLGHSQNDTKAAACFKSAAKQGYAPAQNTLGWTYAEGRGVPHDFAQAVEWFRLAAEQGDAEAQSMLGLMYRHSRGPIQAGSAKQYRREYKNGIKNALSMLKSCKDRLGDFESQYHHAVASYNPLKDKIIGNLIKNKSNEFFEAVMDDDLLSAPERVSFLQKIFEEHRRDKKHSAFSRFFLPAPTSQLTDENYGQLCYLLGSQLYETAGLREYPDRIAQAKIYYNQVPQTSTFYRKAMSELFDLETMTLNWEEQLLDKTQSKEAREDKLWKFHNTFFNEKNIERGHQALDAYYDSEIYRQSQKYLEGEKFTQDLRERNSNFKDIQDKNIIARANKIK